MFKFDVGTLGLVTCVMTMPPMVIAADPSDQINAVPNTSAFPPFKDGKGAPVELFKAGMDAPIHVCRPVLTTLP